MKLPTISLAFYNTHGAIASIEGEDMEEVCVAVHSATRNPAIICGLAAQRLRKLADAFDRLATMDDPFKPATQRAAAKAAPQP